MREEECNRIHSAMHLDTGTNNFVCSVDRIKQITSAITNLIGIASHMDYHNASTPIYECVKVLKSIKEEAMCELHNLVDALK
jgi:hypothetical protein